MPIFNNRTTTERVARLEAQVDSLSLQVRTLLKAQGISAENAQMQAKSLVDLTKLVQQALIAKQAQLVLDLMDEDEPTLEDIFDVDQQKLIDPESSDELLYLIEEEVL